MFSFLKKSPKSLPFPNPETYPYWFQKYDNFKKDTRQGGFLFVGDSITDNFTNLLPGIFSDKVRNQGIAGDTSVGLKKRLDVIISSAPDKIFLMIGTNNLGTRIVKGKTPDTFIYGDVKTPIDKVVNEFLQDLDFIITVIRKGLPETKIYISSILPINNVHNFGTPDLQKLLTTRTNYDIMNVNLILKSFCDLFYLTYVDLFPWFYNPVTGQARPEFFLDGIHPNKDGYELWKMRIKDIIIV